MESVVNSIAAVLLLIGGIFVFIGSVGLLKLPDFFYPFACSNQSDDFGYRRYFAGLYGAYHDA